MGFIVNKIVLSVNCVWVNLLYWRRHIENNGVLCWSCLPLTIKRNKEPIAFLIKLSPFDWK